MKDFDFWNQNPCGADGNLSEVLRQRYRMEPWLPKELRTISTKHEKYLEVGCGQGIDSFYICKNLKKEAKYICIDYSSESVKSASSFIDEARALFDLKIIPQFVVANALSLSFDSEVFDFVYSIGVIHHTSDPQKAINEIYRVLKKVRRQRYFCIGRTL